MKKLILVLPLILTGCMSVDQPIFTSKEQVVITPPPEMYRCPSFPLSSSPTLTDADVARIIAAQHQNNKVCRNSLAAIRQYLEQSKQEIEQK